MDVVKPWWQSKTLWVNALTATITIGTSLAGVLPPQAAGYIATGLAVVNVILRFVTTLPIG